MFAFFAYIGDDILKIIRNLYSISSIGLFSWLDDPNIFAFLSSIVIFNIILNFFILVDETDHLFVLHHPIFGPLNMVSQWNDFPNIFFHCFHEFPDILKKCFLIRKMEIVLKVVMHN